MDDFRAIIDLWPTRVAFAGDVGVPPITAQQWHNRDSIPAAKFNDVVRAAHKAGHRNVTVYLLADLAERKRHARQAAGSAA